MDHETVSMIAAEGAIAQALKDYVAANPTHRIQGILLTDFGPEDGVRFQVELRVTRAIDGETADLWCLARPGNS